jgi:hypothetical protein
MSTYYSEPDQYCTASNTAIRGIPSIGSIPTIASTTAETTATSTVGAGKNGTSISGTGGAATANTTASKSAADGGFSRDMVPVFVSGVLAGIVALVGLLL